MLKLSTENGIVSDFGQLREMGVPSLWTACRYDRVRSGEIDLLEHVNNTVYFGWFENMRVQYMRSLMPDARGGLSTVVKSQSINYHKEVSFGENYLIALRTCSFRRTSFVQEYAVLAPDLRVSGSAVIVMYDATNKKKADLPEILKKHFLEYESAKCEQKSISQIALKN